MQGALRIIEVNGYIMRPFVFEWQDSFLHENVRLLFSVSTEAQPRKLLKKLNRLAN
jgi:7,8-dihydro-6-hydroxymethylpterin-pyrophosphokinase